MLIKTSTCISKGVGTSTNPCTCLALLSPNYIQKRLTNTKQVRILRICFFPEVQAILQVNKLLFSIKRNQVQKFLWTRESRDQSRVTSGCLRRRFNIGFPPGSVVFSDFSRPPGIADGLFKKGVMASSQSQPFR